MNVVCASIQSDEQYPARSRAEPEPGFSLQTRQGTIRANQILLAAGAWLKPVAMMLNVSLPVQVRINTVSVADGCRF